MQNSGGLQCDTHENDFRTVRCIDLGSELLTGMSFCVTRTLYLQQSTINPAQGLIVKALIVLVWVSSSFNHDH